MRTMIFWVGLLFTLIAPVFIGIYYENESTSWVAALCGAFITFMAKIDDLAELSLGPVKARMKEKIEEANATIEQLRDIAASTTGATLTDMMAGRFMGGMSFSKMLNIHDSLTESLHSIGIPPEKISEIENDWRKGISIIYYNAIQGAVERREKKGQINPNATDEEKATIGELKELLEFETWTVPAPGIIRKVLIRHNIENDIASLWIEDYEHFLNNNEIRRRDEFVKQ